MADTIRFGAADPGSESSANWQGAVVVDFWSCELRFQVPRIRSTA
ncbi:hypothetical protein ACFVKB_46090 [Rhodococcus sp. NPDC127530]